MKQSLQDLLLELVQIDSVSDEEKEVSDYIMAYLQVLGLHPLQDEHSMIYCRVGSGENPTLFCAHLDTVEPGNGIKPVIEDGVIRSDGTTILGGDNKVAVAAILYSLTTLLSNHESPNIELLFSVQEETEAGIKAFDVASLEAKQGIIFDGGNGRLDWAVTKASSIGTFSIEIMGKASHTTAPENAINALDAFVSLMKQFSLGRINDYTTFNIGLVRSGDASNTVPGWVHASGDLRSTDHNLYLKMQQDFKDRLLALETTHNVTTTIKWNEYAESYTIDENSELLRKLKNIYKTFDIELLASETTGGSDATFLNKHGIETLCLGDGVQNPHTVDESINVKDLATLQEITQKLIASL